MLFVVHELQFGFYVVWEHKLIEMFFREHEDFKTILPDPLLVLASADL